MSNIDDLLNATTPSLAAIINDTITTTTTTSPSVAGVSAATAAAPSTPLPSSSTGTGNGLPGGLSSLELSSLPSSLRGTVAEGRVFFPKIDLHTHILPENLPDLTKRYGDYGKKWVSLQHHHPCKARMYQGNQFFREIEDNCYRSEPRLRECDATGVRVQVLSTIPVMFAYWAKADDALDLARFLNDHIAAICDAHPTRFVGLCTIPLQDPAMAVTELRRCITEKGFAGVQIGSHVNDWTLSAPELHPVWAEAERLNACIFVHPWDMLGQDVMKKYWLPWLVGMPMESSLAICSLIFGGIFTKYPGIRWLFAHGGGSFPGTIGRVQHGWEVRPDLCAIDCKEAPKSFVGRFWLDSLVHDQVHLKSIVDLVGVRKIVLGTDYPFPLGEDPPGKIIEQSTFLSHHDKQSILWHNGLEWLGMKGDRFLDGKDVASLSLSPSNNTGDREYTAEELAAQSRQSRAATTTTTTGAMATDRVQSSLATNHSDATVPVYLFAELPSGTTIRRVVYDALPVTSLSLSASHTVSVTAVRHIWQLLSYGASLSSLQSSISCVKDDMKRHDALTAAVCDMRDDITRIWSHEAMNGESLHDGIIRWRDAYTAIEACLPRTYIPSADIHIADHSLTAINDTLSAMLHRHDGGVASQIALLSAYHTVRSHAIAPS